MVRMKDVAEKAGVSVATVSNVITGKRPVSLNVRKNVLNAIDEMNYQVNMIARGLKTQRTYTIGVILPDVTKLFFNDVLRGIMTAANSQGYSISIHSSNYDFDKEKNLISMLRGMHVDGIILDSCVDYQHLDEWGKEIVGMLPESTPVISLENILNKKTISSITIDCKYWSAQITQHLINHGHKRIFFISGPASLAHEHERLLGYKHALINNGLQIYDNLITYHDFLSGSAYEVVCQALSDGLEFDAIQASNDQAAIGAIKALKEANIRIPEEIAVIGFDDIFPSSLVTPAVTTVNVPRYDMGYHAVIECIHQINNPEDTPKHIILKCQTIIRNSSVASIETDWNLDNW